MLKRILAVAVLMASFAYAGVPGQKHMSKEELAKLSPEQIGKGATVGTKGHQDRKLGIFQGNQIRVKGFNFGPLGGPDRVDPWPRLEWPAYSGHEYIYEISPLIAAKVPAIAANGDTVWTPIVDDGVQDGGDEDFEPLHGYANPLNDTFAFSNMPNTWPEQWGDYITVFGDTIRNLAGNIWPDAFNRITSYGGGPDTLVPVVTADQEGFYIMRDDASRKFMPGNPYGNPVYFPGFTPEGDSLHGLGVQVDVRGYQWGAKPVEDVLIMSYVVRNVSQYDIDTMVVGMFGDFRIGGPGSDFDDDMYTFDSTQNMVIIYDQDGYGRAADGTPYRCGMVGFKFLESPGVPNDGIDNDGDGMIDESMYDGIDNDHDWDSTSGNWKDDVGRDGIAGTGDIGEGNHVPDWGEPHFDMLDPDEKDELGLTSATFFHYGSHFASQDNDMWQLMTPGTYIDTVPVGDYIMVFGSGYFRLPVGGFQRYSIALVMGQDWDDLYANASKAQEIYNRAYQFPKAPPTPTTLAKPGDGTVTLYWDNAAERSPDFEGYAIYRSEDRGLTWGEPITDAYGRQVYWKPLAQFDVIDGDTGLFPVGVNGAHFYVGNDTGIKHSWTDTTVVNGKHYWYVVTAYATPPESLEIPVLQTSFTLDNNPSVVEVVPDAKPIGYVPAEVEFIDSGSNRVGTGDIEAQVVVPGDVKDNEKYRITFEDRLGELYYIITDVTDSPKVVAQSNHINGEDDGPIFDGIRFVLNNDSLRIDTAYWEARTSTNFDVRMDLPRRAVKSPYDFEVVFGESSVVYYGLIPNPAMLVPVNFKVYRIQGNQRVVDTVAFLEGSPSSRDTMIDDPHGNDIIFTFVWDSTINNYRPSWSLRFEYQGADSAIPPTDGEIAYFHTGKPFGVYDTVMFVTHGEGANNEEIVNSLDSIAVVPNPYVVAAEWEIRDPNIRFGRGDMELHFINLPPECTIRIYTLNGELVDVLHHVPGDPEYIDPGTQKWNLLTKDGYEISYGVYIYHVEVPDGNGGVLATHIGKFAVIK